MCIIMWEITPQTSSCIGIKKLYAKCLYYKKLLVTLYHRLQNRMFAMPASQHRAVGEQQRLITKFHIN